MTGSSPSVTSTERLQAGVSPREKHSKCERQADRFLTRILQHSSGHTNTPLQQHDLTALLLRVSKMPSPKKSPGRKALDGAKPSFDIEAQAASASPSGRHTTNMTYDGYVDHQQPSSNPLGEDKAAIAGGMPVAFKVGP